MIEEIVFSANITTPPSKQLGEALTNLGARSLHASGPALFPESTIPLWCISGVSLRRKQQEIVDRLCDEGAEKVLCSSLRKNPVQLPQWVRPTRR